MPTRTPEEKEFIDSMAIKKADKKCNARTPSGYCKNIAGYGTGHVGNGRCKFHGGSSPGAPIISGLYSSKLKSTLKDEYSVVLNDPNVVEIKSELALTKALMTNFIDSIQITLDDPSSDFWIERNHLGDRVISAQARALMALLETLSKIFQRVVDAENKAQEHLDIKDIYFMVQQVRNIMDDTCSNCPVRAGIGERLTKIKIPHK